MRWLPGLSIRARITLGSLVIAAVLFSIAAFFFRLEVQSILNETTATLLENDTAPVVAELTSDPSKPPDRPGEGQLIAVLDPAGQVQVSSLPKSLTKRITSLVTLGDAPHLVNTGRSTYLVAVETVPTPTGDWVVVAARNEEALTLLLDELTRVLIIGAVVLIVGFGIASWLLTGAALRPVSRLREEAESLSAAGSSAQLPVPAGRDEVSQLAVTLNAFIARLRETGGVRREPRVAHPSCRAQGPARTGPPEFRGRDRAGERH
jgi:methyl-accepting chemotaxis protein